MLARVAPDKSMLDNSTTQQVAARLLSEAGGDRLLTPAECRRLAETMAGLPELWAGAVADRPVTRESVRLFRGAGFDFAVLSWPRYEETDWHDHGGSCGGYVVARGRLREAFRIGDCPAPVTHLRETGASFGFGSRHIHDMVPVGEAAAVSLHVYSPPIETMTYYDITPTGFRPRETVAA